MKADEVLKTALYRARVMKLPPYATAALRRYQHPQERTMAFHRFYECPIGPDKPDRQFSHMSDERVAFRVAFIISELIELLDKGLGLFKEGDEIPSHQRIMKDVMSRIEEVGMKRDLVGVCDALGDLNVVVNGFAIELGVDMDVIDQEICASNFTKAGEDGNPIIGDGTNGPVGKVLKGPNFVEPKLSIVLGFGEDE